MCMNESMCVYVSIVNKSILDEPECHLIGFQHLQIATT